MLDNLHEKDITDMNLLKVIFSADDSDIYCVYFVAAVRALSTILEMI